MHGAAALTVFDCDDHAQKHAEHLAANWLKDHSETNYGENIYHKSIVTKDPKMASYTNGAASKAWYKESIFYDYESTAEEPKNLKSVGQFTQMVWKGTEAVCFGMARSERMSALFPTLTEVMFVVVANYSPKGNVNGEYQQNVGHPA